jgi:hypothetical protein
MTEYHVERNEWGGYVVVNERGEMAPHPRGFNSQRHAEARAGSLNKAVVDAARVDAAAPPREQAK